MLIETTNRRFNHARRIALNARARELRQEIGWHAELNVKNTLHTLESGKRKRPRQLLNYFNNLPYNKRNKVESHISESHQRRRVRQENFLIPRYIQKYGITNYQASLLAQMNTDHTRSRMHQIVEFGRDHNTRPFNADEQVEKVKNYRPITLTIKPPAWWGKGHR